MIIRAAIMPLALAGLALFGLAACGEVTADPGPPVAGTTLGTFNPPRRETPTITQPAWGRRGAEIRSPAPPA